VLRQVIHYRRLLRAAIIGFKRIAGRLVIFDTDNTPWFATRSVNATIWIEPLYARHLLHKFEAHYPKRKFGIALE